MLLQKRLRCRAEVGRHIHLPPVWKGAVHLKERLPQKAVYTLEKTSATAVPCEGKIERIDLCLRPICFACSGPFEKTGCGCAIRRYFLV